MKEPSTADEMNNGLFMDDSHRGQDARDWPENPRLPRMRAATRRYRRTRRGFYHEEMAFPIKICSICGEEFELKPDKPGFANRCPPCSEPEDNTGSPGHSDQLGHDPEANAARRKAIRDLLYRRED